MPAIIGSFEYSGTDYLDKRVSFSSLTALETQTNIKFPNGFECWCELEQTWYQLSTTNPDDISTYIWSERPSGDATIIVDGVQTSDYKFVINRNETESAYGDVSSAILEQITSMFTSLQDTINKQAARIDALEIEVANLKANIGSGDGTVTVTGELVDYSGNTLVDYNNYGIGGYAEVKVDGELVDYNGNTLVDYSNNGIGGYISTDTDNVLYLTDYNGNVLADYDGNTITDYTEILDNNLTYVTDASGNIITDYDNNYLTDFTDNNTYLIDNDENYVVDYNENKIVV